MKRLFIATKVELSPEFTTLNHQLQYALRHDDIVWVQDEVRHLTLRFLGATPDFKIPALKKSIAEVCQDSSPFYLELNKLGAFGSRYKPEVLWLGFDEFFFFKQLFEKLEPKIQELHFDEYYGNFVPHITLGRVKNVLNKQRFWKSVDSLTPTFSQPIFIKELTLYQSFLHNDGPEYKVLGQYELGVADRLGSSQSWVSDKTFFEDKK